MKQEVKLNLSPLLARLGMKTGPILRPLYLQFYFNWRWAGHIIDKLRRAGEPFQVNSRWTIQGLACSLRPQWFLGALRRNFGAHREDPAARKNDFLFHTFTLNACLCCFSDFIFSWSLVYGSKLSCQLQYSCVEECAMCSWALFPWGNRWVFHPS